VKVTKKTKKIYLIIVFTLAVLWVSTLGTDYWITISELEKPIFAQLVNGADDGGSGTYKGIGYSVEIEGNFMPEEEFPGVRQVQFNIFGKLVTAVIVD